jgi:hypothetical protein
VEDGGPAAGDRAEAEEEEGCDVGEHLQSRSSEGPAQTRASIATSACCRSETAALAEHEEERTLGNASGAAVSSSTPHDLLLRIALKQQRRPSLSLYLELALLFGQRRASTRGSVKRSWSIKWGAEWRIGLSEMILMPAIV